MEYPVVFPRVLWSCWRGFAERLFTSTDLTVFAPILSILAIYSERRSSINEFRIGQAKSNSLIGPNVERDRKDHVRCLAHCASKLAEIT